MPFPISGQATTPFIYPAGSTGNTLQATGFIPEIWSGKLVEKFYASTVLAAISNTDYEGEIKGHGDKVKIRTKPTISISDYRADGDLEIQRPSGNVIDLSIDQGKYFNTLLDDVMKTQSDLELLGMWADDAAEQMKIKIDTDVLLYVKDLADTKNKGTTAGKISSGINLGATSSPLGAVAVTASNKVTVTDIILRMGQALDEQNIPETGRWVVVPSWFGTLIKQSELRQVYLSGDGVSMLRNGRLGMIDRFTIYVSNLLPSGTSASLQAGEFILYAGHSHGLTFASQVSTVETLRSERTFGTLLRGLQVYGRKVVDGTALVQSIVTNG